MDGNYRYGDDPEDNIEQVGGDVAEGEPPTHRRVPSSTTNPNEDMYVNMGHDGDDDDEGSNQVKSGVNGSGNGTTGDDGTSAKDGQDGPKECGLDVYKMRPLERDPETNLFPCELCNKVFNVKHTVYRHIKEVHRKVIIFLDGKGNQLEPNKKPQLFTCTLEGCKEVFNTKRNLERHLRHHERTELIESCSPSGVQPVRYAPPPLYHHLDSSMDDDFSSDRRMSSGSPPPPMPVETILEEEDDCDIGDNDIDDIFEEELEDMDDEGDFDDADFCDDEDDDMSFDDPLSRMGMGIPYRCVHGSCPLFFTTKLLLSQHLRLSHKVRMELVPLLPHEIKIVTNNSNRFPPKLKHNTIDVRFSNGGSHQVAHFGHEDSNPGHQLPPHYNENKKFPCYVEGCYSAFTRRDRLNQHLRLKHPGRSLVGPNYSASNMVVEPRPPPTRGRPPSKLPKATKKEQAPPVIVPVNVQASTPLKPPKPKKYSCDVPGCGKSYTKGSHVKRHKLSAHADLFSGDLMNGTTSSTSATNSSLSFSATAHSYHYAKSDNEDEEEDEEEAFGNLEEHDLEGLAEVDEVPSPAKKVKRTGRNGILAT